MRQEEGPAHLGAATRPRSIVVVGDDPLMVRALNRLLSTAGYCVGIGERSVEPSGARGALSPRTDIALTIVDLPDDLARPNSSTWQLDDSRVLANGRVLWISTAPSTDAEADGCLVKPFTSNQLLDKVHALLSRQPTL
jgi:DNA-binding response OmpR family regulator